MPNFTIPATPAGRRVSRDRWIFPRRRVALEFELRWPARFARNFRAQAGWSAPLGTGNRYQPASTIESRTIDLAGHSQCRRAPRCRTSRLWSNEVRHVDPRREGLDQALGHADDAATLCSRHLTGLSSSARRTSISSTWSISRRPCDDGVSEAVVGPAAADRMTVERPVRPIVRSRICARVHARVLFGTCLTGVGGSGWRASRGRGIHGVRPGWCGLRPPSGLAGRGGSNETGKGRQDTRAARARFGKRRRSNAWFLQHENTWRYPISDEPLKYNGPPELEVAVLS